MDFIIRPTLEHTTFVHIAAVLWNQNDIRALIEEFSNSQLYSQLNDNFFVQRTLKVKRGEWRKIEEKVLEKVPQLTMPTSLKEKMLHFIQPVGIQILKWMKYHLECCGFSLGLPERFCWTMHGIIDKKKTAEVIIKDEAIDITTRYKLACINCLEDDIPELWFKLPESCRMSFYNEENIQNEENFQKELLIFWGQYMREIEGSKDNMIRNVNSVTFSNPKMFYYVSENGNKAATEYFLQKLIQREEYLLFIAVENVKSKIREDDPVSEKPLKDCYSEVLCFLLSQMIGDLQEYMFDDINFAVMHCLLDWPCQNLFVETTSPFWNHVPYFKYHWILIRIIRKINQIDSEDYDYRKMFAKLWQQTPHSHKHSFINDDYFRTALYMLLGNKDKENIELIFQDVTLTERKKFIFSDKGRFLFKDMIRHEKWNLIKFFILLCISSKDEMIRFKQEFQEYIPRWLKRYRKDISVYTEERVEEFFQILDDFICW